MSPKVIFRVWIYHLGRLFLKIINTSGKDFNFEML